MGKTGVSKYKEYNKEKLGSQKEFKTCSEQQASNINKRERERKY